MQRRRFLQGTLLCIATPSFAAARPGPRFAAAWDDAAGAHHLGLLAARGGVLQVLRSIELPTRAHGLLLEPGGTLLAAARRPGEWLLRWSPASGAAQWLWAAPERRHTGHLLRSPNGRTLWSAETDTGSGAGLISVRDARSFALRAEWPTHGVDPHQFLLEPDGTLLVANGGVPTRPETGRAKVDLDRMDSSLVRLDAATGVLRGQWRLPDPRLSIRHLARDARGTVGIALQAEHDDAEAKAAAPVLAVFDGEALRTLEAPQPLAGYGGDIAAGADGFAVSVPRAGGIARWSAEGRWLGLVPLAEACALSPLDGSVWAGGRLAALRCSPAGEDTPLATATVKLDNHWLALPRG